MILLSSISDVELLPLRTFPSAPRPPLCISEFALVNQACSMVPIRSGPPQMPYIGQPSLPLAPPPPPPPRHYRDDDNERDRDDEHRRHHRHQIHHRSAHQTSVNLNCCKWLKELDTSCICGLMVRLPRFLIRNRHGFSIIVEDTCDVSFNCEGHL
ncbi:hypothetical protein MKX01_042512 [Papaver californicum]|nr:hypothetical protein MKX01_042512 [Papaver californicum]